ncbi:acylamino-acid-releasing enzyme isoform X2 [Halyomorpha halys]|uniref:acylamino-acid-releasing enzyme isoform X2 n=1 Tax=Halyomorpha halys TaxID=286706 RepID=UPI0006D4CB8F|nr:acylamino-acid-releasing enzyme-like isoform X2 [Halyomorpha halys]
MDSPITSKDITKGCHVKLDKILALYKNVVKKSSLPISGYILNIIGSNLAVKSIWYQRNIERKVAIRSELTQFVNYETKEIQTLTSTDISNELLMSYSPSGSYRALFRHIPALGNSPKKQHLEIWKKNFLWKLFDLTSFNLHGDIATDMEFSSFQWSSCETKILYIAEKYHPKAESFLPLKLSGKSDEDTKKGFEYDLIEDWGEQMTGKCTPVPCICDLEQESISIAAGCPEDLSFGQAIWAPDGGIVAVAWSNLPWRLGNMFCTHRLSWIVHLKTDGSYRKLSRDSQAVRCPKFSPDMKSLIWLEREVGGPHHTCHRLVCYNWTTRKSSIIVDFIQESITITDGQQFYGLYSKTLQPRCWLSDNETLVINTVQRASIKPYLVNIGTKTIRALSDDSDDSFNFGFIDTYKDFMLCYHSSLCTPPSLLLGKISSADRIDWLTLLKQEPIVSNFKTGVLRLNADCEAESVSKFSAIYMVPNDVTDAPLAVWSHGGPHSAFTNEFSILANFLVSLGFGMVMTNVRGTVGAGQASVNFLLGKVGKTDVRDSQQAAETVLKMFPGQLSPDKCVLYGGSYGGFLSLHLAGQYPKVMTLRASKSSTQHGGVERIPPADAGSYAQLCAVTLLSSCSIINPIYARNNHFHI